MDNLHKNIVKLHHFECYDVFMRAATDGDWCGMMELIYHFNSRNHDLVRECFSWARANLDERY